MNTNMEMVKQQLKKMGTHMNELYNQNHVFPEDVLQLGNSLDETSVTASLNAIDSFGYTTDGYTTSANRSYYRFQTCPTSNTAGDRCFFLDSLGTTEDIALALAAFAAGGALDVGDFAAVVPVSFSFGSWNPQNAQSVRNFFLYYAAVADKAMQDNISAGFGAPLEGKDPAIMLKISDSKLDLLKAFLTKPSFVQKLDSLGVNAFYFHEPQDQLLSGSHMIGFKIDPAKFKPGNYMSANGTALVQ
ncbi:MAG: hypothetical protein HY585_05800 [Candidatus Omnitrophica bacterium]|nr:hypothetical protein [Candidatus Omnitrophota bacterium]